MKPNYLHESFKLIYPTIFLYPASFWDIVTGYNIVVYKSSKISF